MNDTAAHLVDRVRPEAPYRQWVLSYPYPVKLALARDAKAAALSCTILIREIFRTAPQAGEDGGPPGGQAGRGELHPEVRLEAQRHLHHHLVVPDAVFEPGEDGGARRLDLPPPTRDELARCSPGSCGGPWRCCAAAACWRRWTSSTLTLLARPSRSRAPGGAPCQRQRSGASP
jgi:hypothetical protein